MRETELLERPLLIIAREAARLLSISERKLWTLTKSGKFPCVRIGASVRYSAEGFANG
jgi:excisionase family DNA binding protein